MSYRNQTDLPPGRLAARLFQMALLSSGMGLAAGPAMAHAHLQNSAPAADAVVAAPSTVEATFTEPLEPRFSSLKIQDSKGQLVATSSTHLAADNPRRLIIDLPALPDGQYTVLWRAASVDTHTTEGRFTFMIGKP